MNVYAAIVLKQSTGQIRSQANRRTVRRLVAMPVCGNVQQMRVVIRRNLRLDDWRVRAGGMRLDVTPASHRSVRRKRGPRGDHRHARTDTIDNDEAVSVLPCDRRSLVRDPASVRRLRECVPLARCGERVVSWLVVGWY